MLCSGVGDLDGEIVRGGGRRRRRRRRRGRWLDGLEKSDCLFG